MSNTLRSPSCFNESYYGGCSCDRPHFMEPEAPPAPRKMKHQVTLTKWEEAELDMLEDPSIHVIKVAAVPGHTYWLLRYDGKFVRVHEES